VCEEAQCPNVHECWASGTATFMLLGDRCTRNCHFCAVKTGNPRGKVDAGEPRRIADAVAELDFSYIVLTSVDRDDLDDGGAGHFAETVRRLKELNPNLLVEVLISDFRGDEAALRVVADAKPDVIAHNVEVIERLQYPFRDRRCGYDQSLEVLRYVKEYAPHIYTKSSLMVGIGETRDEMTQCMKDLRKNNVSFLTVGQYLRPSFRHLAVTDYVHPDIFDEYRQEGEKLGFLYVASGPFVRSSYKAGEHYIRSLIFGE